MCVNISDKKAVDWVQESWRTGDRGYPQDLPEKYIAYRGYSCAGRQEHISHSKKYVTWGLYYHFAFDKSTCQS